MLVKGINIPDKWIDATTELLDCSIEEAIDIYLSDRGKVENEEQKALDDKAKTVKIKHGAESETERKKIERKREPNIIKRELITILSSTLEDCIEESPCVENLKISNIERTIDFTVEGRNFTITLTEHRPKKRKG